MNKDQLKGLGKQVKGQAQKEVGRMTGDTSTRVRGHASEAEGKLQRNVGDAKEALRHESQELDRTRDEKRRSGL